MTENAKSTARASRRDVNRETAGNNPTRLAAQSDDVAARKRAVLRNFLACSFPECLSEGRIDIESLRNALGDWVADGTERFGLVWPGKAQCMRVIQDAEYGDVAAGQGRVARFRRNEQRVHRGRQPGSAEALAEILFRQGQDDLHRSAIQHRARVISTRTSTPRAWRPILPIRARSTARRAGSPRTPIPSAGTTRTG